MSNKEKRKEEEMQRQGKIVFNLLGAGVFAIIFAITNFMEFKYEIFVKWGAFAIFAFFIIRLKLVGGKR